MEGWETSCTKVFKNGPMYASYVWGKQMMKSYPHLLCHFFYLPAYSQQRIQGMLGVFWELILAEATI